MWNAALCCAPPELIEANGEFSIDYDSPLSRSMRAEEASGFMRTLEFATAYANVSQDPNVFDHFDFDTALPEISRHSKRSGAMDGQPEQSPRNGSTHPASQYTNHD